MHQTEINAEGNSCSEHAPECAKQGWGDDEEDHNRKSVLSQGQRLTAAHKLRAQAQVSAGLENNPGNVQSEAHKGLWLLLCCARDSSIPGGPHSIACLCILLSASSYKTCFYGLFRLRKSMKPLGLDQLQPGTFEFTPYCCKQGYTSLTRTFNQGHVHRCCA
eukprot:scaffold85433_cov15-Tisochrysis_lutea.AAC.1